MIRLCKKEEYPIIINILRDSFAIGSIDYRFEQKFGKVIGHEWWERKAVDIMNEVKAAPDGVFVEEINGKLAGFLTTFMDKEFSTGRIRALSILPEFQGKGIGTRLLRHAEEIFKKNGMKLIRIEVVEDNASAYELYKKLGFEKAENIVHLGKRLTG